MGEEEMPPTGLTLAGAKKYMSGNSVNPAVLCKTERFLWWFGNVVVEEWRTDGWNGRGGGKRALKTHTFLYSKN